MMALWRILVIGCVFGLVYSAVTLYRTKVETRELERASGRLETKREALQAQLEALDTEWSYLNSPENLNRLIGLHADVMQMQERDPDSFARLSELPKRGAGSTSTESE